MSLLQIVRDGGTPVLLLVIPACLGTLGLALLRLVLDRRRAGVFEGSVLIVAAAGAIAAAMGWQLAFDIVAEGPGHQRVLALMGFIFGPILLALLAVVALGALELLAGLRRSSDALEPPGRLLRTMIAIGWICLALTAALQAAAVMRFSELGAPTFLEAPGLWAKSTASLLRYGLGAAVATLLTGLATLGAIFVPRR